LALFAELFSILRYKKPIRFWRAFFEKAYTFLALFAELFSKKFTS
jgi:hypothetical protein